MLLTIIWTLLIVLSILWIIFDKKYRWETNICAAITTGIFGLIFIINIIYLATGPACTRSDIKEFEAARLTINQQRADSLSAYERVTLTQTIIRQNQWLAKEQFWAKNIWLNWYYDKSILDIKPVQ